MKTFAMKVVWLPGSLTVLVIVLVGAQSAGQASPDASQEAVESASDAQRVRRIREVIEFDRASLERAIAKLNDELELLRAQSELAIS